MKSCSKCGTSKTLEEFYKNPRSPDGRRGDCKVCILLDRRTRYQSDPAMRERLNAYARQWGHRCPRTPAKHLSPDERFKRQALDRQRFLRTQYGLTPADVELIFADQGQRCAICTSDDPARAWCIDHDHVSGRVRGILCWHCNVALGHLRDDVVSLANAIDYVMRHAENKVA